MSLFIMNTKPRNIVEHTFPINDRIVCQLRIESLRGGGMTPEDLDAVSLHCASLAQKMRDKTLNYEHNS